MKYYILFLLFVSFRGISSSAQEHISGKVADNSGHPVPGAVITLLNAKDSSLIRTALADKNGNYIIDRAGMPQALLRVEKQRFLTQLSSISAADSVINFFLSTGGALQEVVVTDRKKLIEEKADRTVFNVEKSVVAFGGDALEAIKKMPGVQVQQQQISVGGNSGVSIMVNGRLQHLAGDELVQFLRGIPANNIAKIELITSPGAKYDAAGNAGIINLLMKKNIRQGLSGSVSAGYNRNSYNSPSAGLSLQYKTGKFNFYSNDNISKFSCLYTDGVDLYYANLRRNQEMENEYTTRNARAQLGVDYELNKNMTLGLVYTKGFTINDSKDHISSSQFSNSLFSDSVARTEGIVHEAYSGKHTANINYEWRIDTTGKKLAIGADYFTQSLSRQRDLDFKNFSGATPADETQNRIFDGTAITIRSANADLDLPYSFINLSLGAKVSLVDNSADYTFQVQAPGGFVSDSSRSSRFLYTEQIQAAYLSAKKQAGKFGLQGGLRAERTLAVGSTPTGQLFNKNYIQLFPSISTGYKLNEHHNFVIGYMRRIVRPEYNLLNPFRTYYTQSSFQQGNPALQPSVSNNFRLSWLINSKYHLTFRVNQVNNYWDRVYFNDSAAATSLVSRSNLGRAMVYIVNFSFSENIRSWWDLNGEVSGTYNRYWLNAYGTENIYSGSSGWVELNNNFYLNKKKTLVAEFNGYYYSPRQKDYKLWKQMYSFSGGVKALLLDKALVIGLAFDDPFASSRWAQTNKENGTMERSYDDERSITFSLSYKFGNKNQKPKKEHPGTIEEIQRAK